MFSKINQTKKVFEVVPFRRFFDYNRDFRLLKVFTHMTTIFFTIPCFITKHINLFYFPSNVVDFFPTIKLTSINPKYIIIHIRVVIMFAVAAGRDCGSHRFVVYEVIIGQNHRPLEGRWSVRQVSSSSITFTRSFTFTTGMPWSPSIL